MRRRCGRWWRRPPVGPYSGSGIVKTARVRLGNDVTVGLGAVIEIGVEIGSNAQVGALSFVPKHTKLKGGLTYAGVPAVPLE